MYLRTETTVIHGQLPRLPFRKKINFLSVRKRTDSIIQNAYIVIKPNFFEAHESWLHKLYSRERSVIGGIVFHAGLPLTIWWPPRFWPGRKLENNAVYASYYFVGSLADGWSYRSYFRWVIAYFVFGCVGFVRDQPCRGKKEDHGPPTFGKRIFLTLTSLNKGRPIQNSFGRRELIAASYVWKGSFFHLGLPIFAHLQ